MAIIIFNIFFTLPEIKFEDIIKLQQFASNPTNSCWVFASAGSGKTRILVNRILRLLLNDVDPQKILCLTFTKAGASEMHERIENDLTRWTILEDNKLSDEIYQISGLKPNITTLNKARSILLLMQEKDQRITIQTIHSFCQSILKIFPFESKINPNFEILEDNAKKILIKNSFQIIVNEAQNDKDLESILISLYKENNENDIVEIINEFVNKKEDFEFFVSNYQTFEQIEDQIYRKFFINKNDNENDIIFKFKNDQKAKQILDLKKFIENSKLKKEQNLANSIDKFWFNEENLDFFEYYSAFYNKKNEIRKIGKKFDENIETLTIYQDHCTLINDYLDKIKSIKICQNSVLIIKFIIIILNKYKELKQSKGLLDYEDLIVITNKLLENPDFNHWIQMKLDSSFEHILVDESQDTNIKQWQIIKSLSDDFFSGIGAVKNQRSIFVVGDEKQSIYSFQGAESEISSKIFKYFSTKTELIKKVNLNISFRSCKKILDAVDLIFSQDCYAKSVISDYKDYKKHQAIKLHDGIVEIWPLIDAKVENLTDDKIWNLPFFKSKEESSKEILANLIAKKIKSEVLSEKKLTGKNRNVRYEDYMILLRNKTNNLDSQIIKYFNKYNIPYSSQSKINFNDSLIIQDIISLARFTICEFDNLNLACLLKSPFFCLNDNDLIKIINFDRNQDIFDNMKLINEYHKSYLKLFSFKEDSRNLMSYSFFNKILNNKENLNKFINFYGSQALEIIDKFLLILSDYINNFGDNLQKFLEFVDQSNPEISFKNESTNSVRISTIHSAKGLQSPIVIIADCCFSSSKQKSQKDHITWLDHDDNLKMPIWCNYSENQNNIIRNVFEQNNKKNYDEYLRLLYVAMTRSEEELYIAGLKVSNSENCWYDIIKNSLPQNYLKENILEEINNNFSKINLNNDNLDKNDKIIIRQNFQNIEFEDKVDYLKNDQVKKSAIIGKITHKALEFINQNNKSSTDWLIKNSSYIIDHENLIDFDEKIKIKKIIKNYVNSNLFNELSKFDQIMSEVEFKSKKDIIRIDLLLKNSNLIKIIDFKTSKKQEIVPLEYVQQLDNYKKIISELYPNHKISKQILWLEDLQISQLD